MTWRRMLTDRATIVRYGDSEPDAHGETHRVELSRRTWPSSLQAGSSTESVSDRDETVTGYTVYLPPEAILTAGDTVEVRGARFEVDGVPTLVTGVLGTRGPHH